MKSRAASCKEAENGKECIEKLHSLKELRGQVATLSGQLAERVLRG